MLTANDYLKQVHNLSFKPITNFLFNEILEEGFVDDLIEMYNYDYTKNDFEYSELQLDLNDKMGLKTFVEDVINKFNSFDILLKDSQNGYPKIVDFIDYDKGIVYIIKAK